MQGLAFLTSVQITVISLSSLIVDVFALQRKKVCSGIHHMSCFKIKLIKLLQKFAGTAQYVCVIHKGWYRNYKMQKWSSGRLTIKNQESKALLATCSPGADNLLHALLPNHFLNELIIESEELILLLCLITVKATCFFILIQLWRLKHRSSLLFLFNTAVQNFFSHICRNIKYH